MLVISRESFHMAEESTLGRMERCTRVSGKREK